MSNGDRYFMVSLSFYVSVIVSINTEHYLLALLNVPFMIWAKRKQRQWDREEA